MRAADADNGEEDTHDVLLATPPHLNVNKISRQLRRADLSLHNCLLSVDADTAFVSHLAKLFPTLPVVANLRCGLWYTPSPHATAYFKVRVACVTAAACWCCCRAAVMTYLHTW